MSIYESYMDMSVPSWVHGHVAYHDTRRVSYPDASEVTSRSSLPCRCLHLPKTAPAVSPSQWSLWRWMDVHMHVDMIHTCPGYIDSQGRFAHGL